MRDLSFDRVIAFAQELIRTPGGPGGERGVAERVMREMNGLGFRDVRTDEVGNVIGVAPGKGSGPAVMLSSHMDVVDVGDAASWEHPPFEGVVEGGWLHGRGAMDIKGPLAIQTYAAARFLDHPLDGDVIVAHTVLEERGGWGMEHLMKSGAVRPAAVIIGEATHGDICVGHRGRAEIVVEVQGVAGHASAPERARNPLYVLPDVLAALRDIAGELPADPVLGPSTLAPTEVHTLPTSRNVIPDRARVVVDWRVLPDWSAERARTHLEDGLRRRVRLPDGFALDVRYSTEEQHTYTGRERVRTMYTPGFLISPEHPVARAAADAVREATGFTPELRPWTFATDGGHTCGVHGVPTVGFAPGEERYAHTNRERLDLDSARVIYSAYPAVVAAVQRAVASD